MKCWSRPRQRCTNFLFCCILIHIMAAVLMLRSQLKENSTSLRVRQQRDQKQQQQHQHLTTTMAPTPTPTAPPPVLLEVFTKGTPRNSVPYDPTTPVIYVVTPTYSRPEQLAELTRLAQTLMHIPALHWIIVEDSFDPTAHVQRVLHRSKLNYTHILGPRPERPKNPPKYPNSNETLPEPRGVSCRNAALSWLRQNVKSGVMYFADDDNTYDLELFAEMRWTKKVSVWPVGLVGSLGMSSPIVKDGQVEGFYDPWPGGRKFAMDMAGFAVNIAFMHKHPNVSMPYSVGFEEDGFLKCLNLTLHDLEPRAKNCTEVLVWHTVTKIYVEPQLLTSEEIDNFDENNILFLLENYVFQ